MLKDKLSGVIVNTTWMFTSSSQNSQKTFLCQLKQLTKTSYHIRFCSVVEFHCEFAADLKCGHVWSYARLMLHIFTISPYLFASRLLIRWKRETVSYRCYFVLPLVSVCVWG